MQQTTKAAVEKRWEEWMDRKLDHDKQNKKWHPTEWHDLYYHFLSHLLPLLNRGLAFLMMEVAAISKLTC